MSAPGMIWDGTDVHSRIVSGSGNRFELRSCSDTLFRTTLTKVQSSCQIDVLILHVSYHARSMLEECLLLVLCRLCGAPLDTFGAGLGDNATLRAIVANTEASCFFRPNLLWVNVWSTLGSGVSCRMAASSMSSVM